MFAELLERSGSWKDLRVQMAFIMVGYLLLLPIFGFFSPFELHLNPLFACAGRVFGKRCLIEIWQLRLGVERHR